MDEATSSTPIFFILFPGCSPSKEIELYANKDSSVAVPPYCGQHLTNSRVLLLC